MASFSSADLHCSCLSPWPGNVGTTGTPRGRSDALAKRALNPGERLDTFGGYTFHGVIDRAEEARKLGALPVGLAPAAEVISPLAAGEVLNWDDVQLDEESVVVRLRRQQDAPGSGR